MDMWTTQERCPHAHSLNNKYKRLNQPSTKSPTDSPEEAIKIDELGGMIMRHACTSGRRWRISVPSRPLSGRISRWKVGQSNREAL